MSELRWHPLLREWVAVAAIRQDRPQMPQDWCPFDPGSGRVPDHYDVHLYANDFPAFQLDGPPFDPQAGLPQTTGARGACDVVIYHPDHNMTPSQMPVEHWRLVIDLWSRRFCELAAAPDIQYVSIFENTGAAIGVTMPHPHGQIYALPFIPPLVQRELDAASESGECLYCKILAEELADGRRVIAQNGSFVAFVPFFARFPAEVQIYPRKHFGTLNSLTPAKTRDLASMLSVVRRKYDNLFGFPMPLMMFVRQSPAKGGHPYFHFHVEFCPIQRSATKLKYLAGVESGLGTFLNDTVAEERAAALSLALGIGANTAIFSLIDTVMLRMLPVREPGQLVELLTKFPGQDRWNTFSWQAYQHMRDHNQVFSSLIAASNTNYGSFFHVRGEGLEPERVGGEYVTGNFFAVLGVKPAIGRLISAEDDHMGAAPSPVAVVSWLFWKSRFNFDPRILGKRILVEDTPVTIVGVAPREYLGLQVGTREDLWLPLAMEPVIRRPSFTTSSRFWWLLLVGRLRPGVSIEQARAEMAVLYGQAIEEEAKTDQQPGLRNWRIEVEHAGAGLSRLRDQFAKPLLLLMAVVGMLLLIACANVASMLLARGAARQREMALRVSLGASRFRLLRQALTESLLLSIMGGALGVFLAYFGSAALVRIIASARGPRIELQVRPDAGVLLFTAGVALLTGVLFGLAPALRAWGAMPTSSLREVGRAGETRLGRLFGKSLVAAQVALSVALLSGASLFAGHLADLKRLDLGFHRDHVLLLSLDPAGSGYSRERLSRAYQELLGRLEAIPGVRSATLSAVTPISGAGSSRLATVEGYQAKTGERRFMKLNTVGPKYFETLGTPLLAGRDFSFQDQGRSRVAIVNQAMARYYFGDRSPLGMHVTFDGDNRPCEIVGLVGDAKYGEMREATLPTIYLNAFQEGRAYSQFALRTSIDPAAVAGEARRRVRGLLQTVPVSGVTTLADQVDASIVPERLIATLSGLFGALGSVLAALGLYGLLAYTVARRINEIGIRMALGATPGDVMRMVLGDALGMVGAGLCVGAALAFWGKSVAASLIQDLPVQSAVPIAFGAVAMMAVALVAAYTPARRAARVDPMEALRYE